MANELEGRSAIITGAASGIGRAAASVFAEAGAVLTLCDLDGERGEKVCKDIVDKGGRAQFVALDLTDASAVEAMVAQAVSAYGPLHCAFNNAGIVSETFASVDSYEEEEWDRVIRVNLKAPFLCMKYETRAMLETGGGAIVNTASNIAEVGQYNMPAYCASKSGVLGLSRASALDYAKRGIRVNVIMPGVIATPMVYDNMLVKTPHMEQVLKDQHPMGRFGEPEEVARTALFLCSDAASFITGHSLAVDGGYLAI